MKKFYLLLLLFLCFPTSSLSTQSLTGIQIGDSWTYQSSNGTTFSEMASNDSIANGYNISIFQHLSYSHDLTEINTARPFPFPYYNYSFQGQLAYNVPNQYNPDYSNYTMTSQFIFDKGPLFATSQGGIPIFMFRNAKVNVFVNFTSPIITFTTNGKKQVTLNSYNWTFTPHEFSANWGENVLRSDIPNDSLNLIGFFGIQSLVPLPASQTNFTVFQVYYQQYDTYYFIKTDYTLIPGLNDLYSLRLDDYELMLHPPYQFALGISTTVNQPVYSFDLPNGSLIPSKIVQLQNIPNSQALNGSNPRNTNVTYTLENYHHIISTTSLLSSTNSASARTDGFTIFGVLAIIPLVILFKKKKF